MLEPLLPEVLAKSRLLPSNDVMGIVPLDARAVERKQ